MTVPGKLAVPCIGNKSDLKKATEARRDHASGADLGVHNGQLQKQEGIGRSASRAWPFRNLVLDVHNWNLKEVFHDHE